MKMSYEYWIHEFEIIDKGHENEENLPDIQYEWRLK